MTGPGERGQDPREGTSGAEYARPRGRRGVPAAGTSWAKEQGVCVSVAARVYVKEQPG